VCVMRAYHLCLLVLTSVSLCLNKRIAAVFPCALLVASTNTNVPVFPFVCCVSFCVTSTLTKDFNVLVGACVCNLLQHAATHDNLNVIVGTHVYTTLQRTLKHCNTLQLTASHCNTLQRTATHCNALQRTATHCNAWQHTTAHTATR